MQYKAKCITVSDLELTFLTANIDEGNSQEGVFSLRYTDNPDQAVNNLCVFVGQWEIETFLKLCEAMLDHLELTSEEDFTNKSLSLPDFPCVKLYLAKYSKGFYRLTVYFNDQKPKYATNGESFSWGVGAKSYEKMKNFLRAVYLVKKSEWTHRGELLGPISQYISTYSSIHTVEEQLAEVEQIAQAYEQSDSPAELALRAIAVGQKERLLIAKKQHELTREMQERQKAWEAQIKPVMCGSCKEPFMRHPDEAWKKICLDCWKAENKAKLSGGIVKAHKTPSQKRKPRAVF